VRRVFALLLVAPFLANCSDAVTPVAPKGPAHTVEAAPEESALDNGWSNSSDDSWTLDDWAAQGAALAPAADAADASTASAPATGAADVSTMAAPGTGVVMDFGNPDGGSPYPSTHDESYHSRDKVHPGTVVIDRGQTVTFHVYPGHRVAIYKPGKRPEDVDTSGPSIFIFDPVLRKALQVAPVPFLPFTFFAPGRYLVICAVKPHFVLANMYGWVIVR